MLRRMARIMKLIDSYSTVRPLVRKYRRGLWAGIQRDDLGLDWIRESWLAGPDQIGPNWFRVPVSNKQVVLTSLIRCNGAWALVHLDVVPEDTQPTSLKARFANLEDGWRSDNC